MTSVYSRILIGVSLCLAAFIAVVPAASAKKAPKKTSKAVKLTGKVTAVSSSKLTVKSKGKKYSVKLAPTTELRGSDSNDDGSLDSEDISKGDSVRVSGVRKGKQVTAKTVNNLSDPVSGDDDGDGVADDVDVEDVAVVVDDINLEQEVISVTVLAGDFAGQQMIIDTSSTLLITGDRNRDRDRTLEDFAVGDQLKVLLLTPINPDNPQALVIIDKTSLGQAKKQKRNRGGLPVAGTVQSVDGETGRVVIVPSVDGVELPAVSFITNSETKFEIADSNGDGARNVSDIAVDSELKAILRGSEGSLFAVKVEDEVWEVDEGRPEGDDRYDDQEVRGIVASINLATKTITLTNPRDGQTRTITFDEVTDIRTDDNNKDGRRDAADIVVGAKIEAVVDGNGRAVVLAVHVEDDNSDDQSDDNKQDENRPPQQPAPLVWKGEITAKSADSLSLRFDGGPLEGQTWVALTTPQTVYGGPKMKDKNGDKKLDAADISLGDEAVITINNSSEKKAIAVFVDND